MAGVGMVVVHYGVRADGCRLLVDKLEAKIKK